MSFGETLIGVNSAALYAPLNQMIWLNDYKTYGENSYVFNDKNIYNELMQSALAINDKDTCGDVLQYCIKNPDIHIGRVLSQLYGMGATGIKSLTSIDEIVGNESVMDVLAANETFMAAIAGSEGAMLSLFSSRIGLSVVAKNEIASSLVEKSEYKSVALNSPLLSQITGASIGTTESTVYDGISFLIGYSQNDSAGSGGIFNYVYTTVNGETLTYSPADSYNGKNTSGIYRFMNHIKTRANAPNASVHKIVFNYIAIDQEG